MLRRHSGCISNRTEVSSTAIARKRLFVLEDSSDNADALAEFLRVGGYDVDVAADAATALEVFIDRRPDIAVVDLTRANEVPNVVRALKCRGTAVVVFSAWPDLGAAAKEAGADAFVMKPFIDKLERCLHQLAAAWDTDEGR